MDEMIHRHLSGVNEMNGDVYVDYGPSGVSAFEESGFQMLHGGDEYEYDGQMVGRKDVVSV